MERGDFSRSRSTVGKEWDVSSYKRESRCCHCLFKIKAIYACRGREAPPVPFPRGAEGRGATNISRNDSTSDATSKSGSGGQQPRMFPPLAQTGGPARGSAEEQPQQLADGGDQDARNLFYRQAGVGGFTAENAEIGGGEKVAFGQAAANDALGAPPRELELGGLDNGGGAGAESGLPPATTATTDTGCSTADSSSLPSTATSILRGRAPKLLDFFDDHDEQSTREFKAARDYLEEFRELNLDRAILQAGLEATGERLAALNLPLVARYTFQVNRAPA